MAVFQQYREVVTADAAFTDLDMDIRVTMAEDGTLKFDITMWNLTVSTWASIQPDDVIQVKGGWVNGPTEVLVYGKVNSKDKEVDGNDVQFTIKGKDQSASALNARISRTWNNQDPGDISADIAREVGLAPQTVTVGDTIQGNWSATRDRQLKKWLDDLVEIAGEKTGEEWEWVGEQGELVFQPKSGTYREAPVLSWDTNLVSIGEQSGSDSDEGDSNDRVKFESMLMPGIKKGAAVDVQADRFTDIWKVQSYEHQTATSGDHFTQGVLIPTDKEYEVEAGRAVDAAERAIDNLGGL